MVGLKLPEAFYQEELCQEKKFSLKIFAEIVFQLLKIFWHETKKAGIQILYYPCFSLNMHLVSFIEFIFHGRLCKQFTSYNRFAFYYGNRQ